jgi:tetratricopeptide (TPR) repeat protein
MAEELFQRAYQLHMQGDLGLAVELYRKSLEVQPTAEGHTYLGWAYSHQGKLPEAMEECKRAIALDPEFGNPYNDIGAYLLQMNQPAEAIPWLEKATKSKRYQTYHYPWFNLGRAYVALEMYSAARQSFENALDIEPEYAPAVEGLERVKRMIQ